MAEEWVQEARGPAGNLSTLFRLAHQRFRDDLTEALRPHGLSVAQYAALSAFDLTDAASSAELARAASVTPQSMNAVVASLVEARLLLQRQSRAHRRVLLLSLTRPGRRRLDAATRDVRRVEAAALDDLSERDRRAVLRWLSRTIA